MTAPWWVDGPGCASADLYNTRQQTAAAAAAAAVAALTAARHQMQSHVVQDGVVQHRHGSKQYHPIHSKGSTCTIGSGTHRMGPSGQAVPMQLAVDVSDTEEDGAFQIMKVRL
jgi:hypothetical protein